MSIPCFVMITDSRLATSADGCVATNDPALVGLGWHRGLEIPEMRLAARVDPVVGSGHLLVAGDVTPLAHYVGLAQFFRRAPRLIRQILGLVSTHDVVITRLPGLVGLVTVAIAVVLRRPRAIEVVGDPLDALGRDSLRRRLLSVVGQRATRWATRRGHAVRYVTQEILQAAYPAKPGAVTVGFSSVQSALWFSQEESPVATSPTVVALGSQEQLYKGHDLLIRALPAVRAAIPGARLQLLGDGVRQPELRLMCHELQVSDAVDFLGHVAAKADVIRAVDEAWVFAMPSRAEGLPRALVEAMARGKACVGTRVGGIPELLDESQLVDVDEEEALVATLVRLLSDAEERQRLGRRNRRAVEPYRPEALAASSRRWTAAVRALGQSRSTRRRAGKSSCGSQS